MVEGHSVHRVATFHQQRLIGKTFTAFSPNGRFDTGAAAINGCCFVRIEAVGKNLFAFFVPLHRVNEPNKDRNVNRETVHLPLQPNKIDHDGLGSHRNDDEDILVAKGIVATDEWMMQHPGDVIVVHVHFGMAGNWAVYETTNNKERKRTSTARHQPLNGMNSDEDEDGTRVDPHANGSTRDNDDDDDDMVVPEPTATNRLRLINEQYGLTADLSAMTVQHGDYLLYINKKLALGQDPLRSDANPDILWEKIQASNNGKKSIGAIIMDQAYFCGPGNIYRAEILFVAGIHPDRPAKSLMRAEFDRIWHFTVALMQRGYSTGSILTVDPAEAQRLGKPRLRRYVYNQKHCPRCASRIQVWPIAGRKCYACPRCQPIIPTTTPAAAVATTTTDCPLENCEISPMVLQSTTTTTAAMTSPSTELKSDMMMTSASPAQVIVTPEHNIKKSPNSSNSSGCSLPLKDATTRRKGTIKTTTRPKTLDCCAPGESSLLEHGGYKSGSPQHQQLTLAELKMDLQQLGVMIPRRATKCVLIALLWEQQQQQHVEQEEGGDCAATQSKHHHSAPSQYGSTAASPPSTHSSTATTTTTTTTVQRLVSSVDAAIEKAMAGESLAVEHIAELAPQQARHARRSKRHHTMTAASAAKRNKKT